MKRSKRYQSADNEIDKSKVYSLLEGIELLKKIAPTKFDASVEIHFGLGIDPKKADQQVRSTAMLPHPTGRKLRIAVFADEAEQRKSKEAGAEVVGSEELIKNIKETQKADFDVALATPKMMRSLGPIAKILGTKGLMPNPKSETVTPDPAKTVADLLGGKIAFRADDTGNVHQMIGKISADVKTLAENAEAMVQAIRRVKPDGTKGEYVKSITLSTTMSPGIRVQS
ncbi:MAG: 50S ribosomal protein L1 [bacterium]|nr:50S ribosomal protein L1 [bacterium]